MKTTDKETSASKQKKAATISDDSFKFLTI
jgi:hypothetical protein